MALLEIEISPELERQLRDEAAKSGQDVQGYARGVLAARVTQSSRLLPDGLPPRSGEELLALAREQGVEPVDDPGRLIPDWSDNDDPGTVDVDAFLAALREGMREVAWTSADRQPLPTEPEP